MLIKSPVSFVHFFKTYRIFSNYNCYVSVTVFCRNWSLIQRSRLVWESSAILLWEAFLSFTLRKNTKNPSIRLKSTWALIMRMSRPWKQTWQTQLFLQSSNWEKQISLSSLRTGKIVDSPCQWNIMLFQIFDNFWEGILIFTFYIDILIAGNYPFCPTDRGFWIIFTFHTCKAVIKNKPFLE